MPGGAEVPAAAARPAPSSQRRHPAYPAKELNEGRFPCSTGGGSTGGGRSQQRLPGLRMLRQRAGGRATRTDGHTRHTPQQRLGPCHRRPPCSTCAAIGEVADADHWRRQVRWAEDAVPIEEPPTAATRRIRRRKQAQGRRHQVAAASRERSAGQKTAISREAMRQS